MAKAAKAKQVDLPCIEQPDYPILEEIAGRLYDLQEERMQLGKREKSERDLLKIKMQEFKLDKYKLKDGKWIELEAPEPKAFVRAEKKKDPEEVESRAEVRESDEIIGALKASQSRPAEEETTTEQSQGHVVAFLRKKEPKQAESVVTVSICVCEHTGAEHEGTVCKVEGCGCDYFTENTGATMDANRPNDRGLAGADYLRWAVESGKENPASVARLAQVKRDRDEEVIDWLFSNPAPASESQLEEEVQLPENSRDCALVLALTMDAGSAARWNARREKYPNGIPDDVLTAAIAEEFTPGAHQRVDVGFYLDDGKIPKFWFGQKTKAKQPPTLQGVRLLAETRRVLGLKAPVKAKVTKNKPTHAHA